MKVGDAYPSKYLAAADLDGRDITVTIDDVKLEDIGQGQNKEQKLVISMKGKDKQFVVNKTNAKTISKVLGSDDTDDWIGQRIIIGPREVEFQGDMIWSLRVSLRSPASAQAAPAARQPAPPVDPVDLSDAPEDDIPF